MSVRAARRTAMLIAMAMPWANETSTYISQSELHVYGRIHPQSGDVLMSTAKETRFTFDAAWMAPPNKTLLVVSMAS